VDQVCKDKRILARGEAKNEEQPNWFCCSLHDAAYPVAQDKKER